MPLICDTVPPPETAPVQSGGSAACSSDHGLPDGLQTPTVKLVQRFLAYSDRNRTRVLSWAALMISVILLFDWKFITDRSIGFLYIIPILLVSGSLTNRQVLGLAVICSVLREQFTPGDWGPGATFRVVTGCAGFALAGFFVSELNRERNLVLEHLQRREEQIRLREDAEQQIRVLIETSPLAIFTLDSSGRIRLANQSAHAVLGVTEPLAGIEIQAFLPILKQLLRSEPADGSLRTVVECKGVRRSGEAFLAHIWLSTWMTSSGANLAAVVWDSSETVRSREGTRLDSMIAISRVLIGAVSHEIRNLASAGSAAHQHLGGLPGAESSEHYRALGAILQGLSKIATSGLREASPRTASITDLGTVLDETRIIIEESIEDIGGSIRWRIPPDLPLVQIDPHNLLQVFLNLARNSERALHYSSRRELEIEAGCEGDVVVVRFRDTGPGVARPEDLFQPFQSEAEAAGLGLYISRAILRASGGDLRYEAQPAGSCFAVELWPAEDLES